MVAQKSVMNLGKPNFSLDFFAIPAVYEMYKKLILRFKLDLEAIWE